MTTARWRPLLHGAVSTLDMIETMTWRAHPVIEAAGRLRLAKQAVLLNAWTFSSNHIDPSLSGPLLGRLHQRVADTTSA
jgi:hypothetical protein